MYPLAAQSGASLLGFHLSSVTFLMTLGQMNLYESVSSSVKWG